MPAINGATKRGVSEILQDDHPRLQKARRDRRSDSKVSVLQVNGTAAALSCDTLRSALYSQNVHLKIWAVANKALLYVLPPSLFPEYTEPGGTDYVYRDAAFWTSGFFPGSLYLLLERYRKHPGMLKQACGMRKGLPHRLSVEFACKWWTENLHQNATLMGTHDIGFLIMPWARLSWEMLGDVRSLQTISTAANTLADRFDPVLGCIRSWDTCNTKLYSFNDTATDFLVIIDNMMNLDLLFYAAAYSNDDRLFNIAKQHASKCREAHIRSDFSTTHVINFDPCTGEIKERLTNQGMAHDSCWARGQAWAIAGFSETYHWTGDNRFLETALGCADYFIARLPESKIPPWDFDAPEGASPDSGPPDTSAAMIAAYGLLLIHKALSGKGQHETSYLTTAMEIARAVCSKHMNAPAKAIVADVQLKRVEKDIQAQETNLEIDGGTGDTILNGATINNFEFAPRRWANHGLVYADYYFMLFGNKLLDMGIEPTLSQRC